MRRDRSSNRVELARPRRPVAVSTIAGVIALAWGSLAFGAVYPWAYWPLLVLCAVSGGLGLLGRGDAPLWSRSITLGCALLISGVLLQLVPMPEAAVAVLSPSGDRLIHERRRIATAGTAMLKAPPHNDPGAQAHPLSVDPPATLRGLAFGLVLALFLLGTTRALDQRESRRIVVATSVLGVALALAGVAQQSGGHGKVYGLWQPYYQNTSFGPFINRNHFAGWMLMTIPLSLGYFGGRASQSLSAVGPHWRDRLLWLSTSSANRLILSAFGIVVMVLSLAMTASRAGIVCLVVGFIFFGAVMPARRTGGFRRAFVVVSLLSIFALSIGWAGSDTIVERFAQLAVPSETGRPGIWRDTLRMLRHFPLVGSGLNTYGAAMASYRTPDMNEVAVEAHNDYLQLAAEGGMLLVAPAAILAVAFIRVAKRRLLESVPDSMDSWVRNGALSGLVAISIQELVDFSLQIPGNAVLFVVLCALAARPPEVPAAGTGARAPSTVRVGRGRFATR